MIAIIVSILFIVILIVSIIIFIIINGKSNADNVSSTGIKTKTNTNKHDNDRHDNNKDDRYISGTGRRRHRKSKSSKSSKSDCDMTSNILDICGYSKYIVYLLNDHTFQIQESIEDEPRIIKCDLHVVSIASFEGHLYALANGKLYKLDNNTLESNTWSFIKVSWSPDSIIDISVPHNRKIIWIRCKDYGYIYDTEGTQMDSVRSPSRRIYGVDEHNYITIHNNSGVLLPGNQVIKDIRDAIITHEGELFTVSVRDKYKMIKMIDWKPYYIM